MKKVLKDFLAGYSPEVRETATKLRDLVLSVAPDASEDLEIGYKLVAYGYGPKDEEMIGAIAPFRAHVNLNLYKAIELADPEGLLEGTGKKNRHVRINGSADIENPHLRRLLEAAVAAARERHARAGDK